MVGTSPTTRQKVLWLIAIAMVLLYALIPVVWLAMLSLKKSSTIGTDTSFFPKDATLDNYSQLFKSGSDFTHALVNSFGIAAIATLIAIVLAAMAAYALARLNFAGKTLILSGALAIAMFPPISIVGPLYNMWRNLGLFDTWLGLIIPYITFALPLAIYTLSAFFGLAVGAAAGGVRVEHGAGLGDHRLGRAAIRAGPAGDGAERAEVGQVVERCVRDDHPGRPRPGPPQPWLSCLCPLLTRSDNPVVVTAGTSTAR